jgi:hypothetical protein
MQTFPYDLRQTCLRLAPEPFGSDPNMVTMSGRMMRN